jgi:hypothetical protein
MSRPATCSSVSKCSRVRTTIATYASGAAANTARSARSSCRICRGRSPASVGRTKSGCKIPACPLTDRLQFDILQSGPGWRGSNATRSNKTARVHHAPRRRGGRVACAQQAAVPVIGFLRPRIARSACRSSSSSRPRVVRYRRRRSRSPLRSRSTVGYNPGSVLMNQLIGRTIRCVGNSLLSHRRSGGRD